MNHRRMRILPGRTPVVPATFLLADDGDGSADGLPEDLTVPREVDLVDLLAKPEREQPEEQSRMRLRFISQPAVRGSSVQAEPLHDFLSIGPTHRSPCALDQRQDIRHRHRVQ